MPASLCPRLCRHVGFILPLPGTQRGMHRAESSAWKAPNSPLPKTLRGMHPAESLPCACSNSPPAKGEYPKGEGVCLSAANYPCSERGGDHPALWVYALQGAPLLRRRGVEMSCLSRSVQECAGMLVLLSPRQVPKEACIELDLRPVLAPTLPLPRGSTRRGRGLPFSS